MTEPKPYIHTDFPPCNHQVVLDHNIYRCTRPEGHNGVHSITVNEVTLIWGYQVSDDEYVPPFGVR